MACQKNYEMHSVIKLRVTMLSGSENVHLQNHL